MREDKKRIGEMLVEAGLITELQLSSALGEQKQWGGKLASVIVSMGFVDEKAIASVLEKQLGQSCISLDDREIPPEVLKRVKLDIAKKYCIIPLDFDKGTLTMAMSDPTDLNTTDELSFILGVKIKPVLAIESGIRNAIAMHYEGITLEGKTYKSVVEGAPEKIGILRTEHDLSPPPSPERVSSTGLPSEKKEITAKMMVEAIVAVLIEKRLITREELFKKIKEKSGQG